ncbi:MAG TPA: hypothetical protein VEC14_08130 [Reyranellaceae bacterium]|nr:hypothetical protein [Reyranellaceae bacterium]
MTEMPGAAAAPQGEVAVAQPVGNDLGCREQPGRVEGAGVGSGLGPVLVEDRPVDSEDCGRAVGVAAARATASLACRQASTKGAAAEAVSVQVR